MKPAIICLRSVPHSRQSSGWGQTDEGVRHAPALRQLVEHGTGGYPDELVPLGGLRFSLAGGLCRARGVVVLEFFRQLFIGRVLVVLVNPVRAPEHQFFVLRALVDEVAEVPAVRAVEAVLEALRGGQPNVRVPESTQRTLAQVQKYMRDALNPRQIRPFSQG